MASISIDALIDIVSRGGAIKTGVDIYSSAGILLLDQASRVSSVTVLETLKKHGIQTVPFVQDKTGCGVWDKQGNAAFPSGPARDRTANVKKQSPSTDAMPPLRDNIEKRLAEIQEIKALAAVKYDTAKEGIRRVFKDIRKTGGEFDFAEVETTVSDLVEFLTVMDNPFSYLTREIFTYDDYLYNHSVNVCAIGTAILNRFNTHFSTRSPEAGDAASRLGPPQSHKSVRRCYTADEIQNISIGMFLHDIGKVMVPDEILNKKSALTPEEFEIVKRHSFHLGGLILEKNNLKNPFVTDIVKYHHAALFDKEERCYPESLPEDIPVYAKMCKLADIYDAMTSKRCYKEALNQIHVVTEIFRKFASKDPLLQQILFCFVKSIGIYPPGSIIFLKNAQMAYVVDSDGPLVIPFTDPQGKTLTTRQDALNLGDPDLHDGLKPDNQKSIRMPLEVVSRLPDYLEYAKPVRKTAAENKNQNS
ncbi:MAG: HD domain-containing phosphohydrolase [Pseudomonadota bacterium]